MKEPHASAGCVVASEMLGGKPIGVGFGIGIGIEGIDTDTDTDSNPEGNTDRNAD